MDDFNWGGSELFQNHVIDEIRKTFSISQEISDKFKYLGLDITQGENEITVKQRSYIQDLTPMEVPQMRNKVELLNKMDKRNLKVVAGQINWVVSQSRPDLAYDICEINTSIKGATVENTMFVSYKCRVR